MRRLFFLLAAVLMIALPAAPPAFAGGTEDKAPTPSLKPLTYPIPPGVNPQCFKKEMDRAAKKAAKDCKVPSKAAKAKKAKPAKREAKPAKKVEAVAPPPGIGPDVVATPETPEPAPTPQAVVKTAAKTSGWATAAAGEEIESSVGVRQQFGPSFGETNFSGEAGARPLVYKLPNGGRVAIGAIAGVQHLSGNNAGYEYTNNMATIGPDVKTYGEVGNKPYEIRFQPGLRYMTHKGEKGGYKNKQQDILFVPKLDGRIDLDDAPDNGFSWPYRVDPYVWGALPIWARNNVTDGGVKQDTPPYDNTAIGLGTSFRYAQFTHEDWAVQLGSGLGWSHLFGDEAVNRADALDLTLLAAEGFWNGKSVATLGLDWSSRGRSRFGIGLSVNPYNIYQAVRAAGVMDVTPGKTRDEKNGMQFESTPDNSPGADDGMRFESTPDTSAPAETPAPTPKKKAAVAFNG